MNFKHVYFAPEEEDDLSPAGDFETNLEDERPVYVYTPEIKLAVNVAFAADRPLLVTGPPGSGKSTLARNVAEVKGWRYLPQVITSRTQATDLLAQFDALRRLNDAYLRDRELLPDSAYVEPGVLWWAFNPNDAKWRGVDPEKLEPGVRERFRAAEEYGTSGREPDAVVLLDEIDKADPDVPNDLLEPLDRGTFVVRETNHLVERKCNILVVITTNRERDLPPAFMRRCVVLNLTRVDEEWLVNVATRHYGPGSAGSYCRPNGLYHQLAKRLLEMQRAARKRGLREPSSAEYLNSVRACGRLGVTPGTELWSQVERVLESVLWKHEMKERTD